MKRLVALVGCVVLFALTGCQERGHDEEKAVEVIIEGGGEFPQSLVGRWKNEKRGWEIVFEPNGAIPSVIIPLALVEVRPGQITTVHGRKGEPGIFEGGGFEVYFDPQSRELSVYIKMERIYMDMGRILEGPVDYFIVGNVSEDGKTWGADVFTSIDLAILTPDPNHREDRSKFKKTGELRSEFGDGGEEHLIFTKVPDGNAPPQ